MDVVGVAPSTTEFRPFGYRSASGTSLDGAVTVAIARPEAVEMALFGVRSTPIDDGVVTSLPSRRR
jgi:hypothetical protein